MMAPPGPLTAPWPSSGSRNEDGRVPDDEKYCYHICQDCLQALVLRTAGYDDRDIALRSKASWAARQELMEQARQIIDGHRKPGPVTTAARSARQGSHRQARARTS